MLTAIRNIFRPKPLYRPGPPPESRIILTDTCLAALQQCMEPEIRQKHEGVCYLVGLSDGHSTVAIAAYRPPAHTTRGSFSVTSPAVAGVVRAAVDRGLQLVGQVHTHPGMAFHSEGDDEGARFAYSGYASIVIPNYGERLPSLDGAAAFMYRQGVFAPLDSANIIIVPGRLA